MVNLFEMDYNDSDLDAVRRVLERGTWWTQGPEIEEFEKALAQYHGRQYCTVFNSGTTALIALLSSIDCSPHAEVIVPSYTFIATANAVLWASLKPVFADIEAETFSLSLSEIQKEETDKTKIVIPIHYAGTPCRDIKQISEWCLDQDIILIEDCAEALGASIANKRVGTFGDAAMFSFCQSKNITTGEGGAIVSDNLDWHHNMELIRSQGRYGFDGDFEVLGTNYRMPSMNAALGLSQLRRLEELNRRRQNAARVYDLGLGSIGGLQIWNIHNKLNPVYQMYPILVQGSLPHGKRDNLQAFLTEKTIGSRVYFPPVHRSKLYRTRGYKTLLPVTERVSTETLCIPMYPGISSGEQLEVIQAIEEFFAR